MVPAVLVRVAGGRHPVAVDLGDRGQLTDGRLTIYAELHDADDHACARTRIAQEHAEFSAVPRWGELKGQRLDGVAKSECAARNRTPDRNCTVAAEHVHRSARFINGSGRTGGRPALRGRNRRPRENDCRRDERHESLGHGFSTFRDGRANKRQDWRGQTVGRGEMCKRITSVTRHQSSSQSNSKSSLRCSAVSLGQRRVRRVDHRYEGWHPIDVRLWTSITDFARSATLIPRTRPRFVHVSAPAPSEEPRARSSPRSASRSCWSCW